MRGQPACQSVARQSRRCTQWCVYTRRPAGRASMSTLVGAPSLAHPSSSSPTLLISASLILREGAGFTRYIVGVPKAESDAILGFLFAQINQNHQFQVRFKWEPNDVAIWDNRVRITSRIYIPLQKHMKYPRTDRDALRHVRLLARDASCSARHAARRASNLRRRLRAHDREASKRSSAGAVGATGDCTSRAEGVASSAWIQ